MSKYQAIIDAPWGNTRLYAESIPHLFHWDLAYLWMLEKVDAANDLELGVQQIPSDWKKRIDAWYHLVSLLMMGELEIEKDEIGDPFVKYTSAYGIESVYWLRVAGKERIGVLSPIVLARPFPDFRPDDREHWPEHPYSSKPAELVHFTGLVAQDLKRDQEETSFRFRIAKILERRKPRVPIPRNFNPPRGRSVPFLMLRDLRWVQQGGQEALEKVELLIRDSHFQGKIYAPRCRQCGNLLLRSEEDDPVTIRMENDETFEVFCVSEQCGTSNILNLKNFLIWNRSESEVILWGRSNRVTDVPEMGYPPKADIEGDRVIFEWNAAQIGGERTRRYLKFYFPDKVIKHVIIDDIIYRKLLVPGDSGEFKGYPVRFDWYDVLEDPSKIGIEGIFINDVLRIRYSNMQLRGWPMPIKLIFTGSHFIREERELGVGMYPNPRLMPSKWKWYRSFIHGATRKDYRMQAPSSKNLLPWVAEEVKGPPPYFSVTVSSNLDIGVTFRSELPESVRAVGNGDIFMGVDFGTTNSVIYALRPGQDETNISHRENGVRPDSFHEAIQWLAKIDTQVIEEEYSEHIADFLPGSKYSQGLKDPYIIPSAIWELEVGQSGIIRWHQASPYEGARPYKQFKLDKPGLDYDPKRLLYLRELLLLSIPAILNQAAPDTHIGKIVMGFSYPLALDYVNRNKMAQLLGELQNILKKLTGLNYDLYSINESMACVKAFGEFNPDETFLIADMGGGTMDVALLTVRAGSRSEIRQIGSIRFAGENFIDTLVLRMGVGHDTWSISDKIRTDTSPEVFGRDQNVRKTLSRFMTLAWEFLRTMVVAHIHEQPEQPTNIILVGNGWHLVEAMSEEIRSHGPARVFSEYYESLTAKLGYENVKLHREESFKHLPSTKHLVVIGALNNAAGSNSVRELEVEREPALTKLPAGRNIVFHADDFRKEILWYELIGDALPLDGLSRSDYDRCRKDFDLQMVPEIKQGWVKQLCETFGISDLADIPYPEESRLRQQLSNSVRGDPVRLTASPLQIILERRWLRWLKEETNGV